MSERQWNEPIFKIGYITYFIFLFIFSSLWGHHIYSGTIITLLAGGQHLYIAHKERIFFGEVIMRQIPLCTFITVITSLIFILLHTPKKEAIKIGFISGTSVVLALLPAVLIMNMLGKIIPNKKRNQQD